MIRKMQDSEVDTIGKIWLDGNLEAHNFINPNYWISYLPEVKEQFNEAEIYVYDQGGIKGFAGLKEDFIAGIFVDKASRDQGIGKQLLDYLKQSHRQLTLEVYKKNERAEKFYEANGFRIAVTGTDDENDEPEYQMIWKN